MQGRLQFSCQASDESYSTLNPAIASHSSEDQRSNFWNATSSKEARIGDQDGEGVLPLIQAACRTKDHHCSGDEEEEQTKERGAEKEDQSPASCRVSGLWCPGLSLAKLLQVRSHSHLEYSMEFYLYFKLEK